MNLPKNINFNKKTTTTIIATILVLTVAISILAAPMVTAHDPPQNIKTYAFVNASPNPVGLGQQVIIVMWLNWPPPTAGGVTGDRWSSFYINVTRPDGTVDNLGKFVSDPVGSSFTTYVPTALGEYTVNFAFDGQVLQRAGYTGLQGSASDYVNDTFLPSKANTTFTVQQEPIQQWEQAPLPVSYWTRPIDTMNTNWYVLGSNWLGQSEQGYNYLRYQSTGVAPNSAHVMWTLPITAGGVVGGSNIGDPQINFYSGTAYQYRFPNPLIIYGRLYYAVPSLNSPTGGGYASVDLRTGEQVWQKDFGNNGALVPAFGQVYDFESPNQHGVNPNGYLWLSTTVTGTSITNPGASATETTGNAIQTSTSNAAFSASGWVAVDPQTGNLVFNETNIPSGTRWYGPKGEVMISNIGRENTSAPYTYLWSWNNTRLPGNDIAGGITQWLPGRGNWNMSKSYDYNVTLSQPLPVNNTAIIQVLPGDLIFGRSSNVQFTSATGGAFGTPDPYTLWAINLNESRGHIGDVMWIRNYTGSDQMTILIGPRDQKTNVFVTYNKETLQWTGYSLLNGDYLWGPTAPEASFNFYGGTTGLTAPYAAGNGTLYSVGYSGTLYAYDFATGKVKFTYGNSVTDPSNSTRTSETAYGAFPYQVAGVQDGKVFMISSEHSLNAPPFKGAETRAIDANTGKEIWKLVGMVNWQEVALADGYFVYFNLNDARVYAIGPGPSSATVTTSSAVAAKGSSVLVTGTVLDQSPNTDLKGTPAISDADQGKWMDYMVMHNIAKPDVTGVEVSIDAVDPNHNIIHIGTATSDENGVYQYLWNPDVTGQYAITATFKGTQSYGPSSAGTAFGLVEATTTPPPQYPQPIDNTQTIALSAAAIIIVVIIVAILIMMMLRKRA